MRHQIDAILETFATTAFVLTTVVIAAKHRLISPAPADDGLNFTSDLINPVQLYVPDSINGIVSQPVNGALWSLLAAAVVAAGLHLTLRIGQRFSPPPQAAITLGLLGGALWPWLVEAAPGPGLGLGAAALVCLLAGLMEEADQDRDRAANWLMGMVAGWSLVALMGSGSAAVQTRFGIEPQRALLVALLATSLIGARLQLALGGNTAFALALIWALIGVAAASLGASLTIATACVLGIASLAVVIVRVTT